MLKATFIGIDKYADSSVRELTGTVRDATALWALGSGFGLHARRRRDLTY
jgi:hypothetical protein